MLGSLLITVTHDTITAWGHLLCSLAYLPQDAVHTRSPVCRVGSPRPSLSPGCPAQ